MTLESPNSAGPTFVGIGAMRAGTTWTYRCLAAHPDIEFPAGKQVHFWDRHRGEGLDWYSERFAGATARHLGDITPAYAVLDRDVVAEIAQIYPQLRPFFIVRHPVARAWSAARLHIRRQELDPDTLGQDWYEQRLSGGGMRVRNDYRATIDNWESAFGADGLLVVSYDQLSTDPRGFLIRIADHIGADPAPFAETSGPVAKEIDRVRNAGTPVEMPPELAAFAGELFADEIRFFEAAVATTES